MAACQCSVYFSLLLPSFPRVLHMYILFLFSLFFLEVVKDALLASFT